ncbi:serine protease inhibitor 42Dd-like isoform X2 [Drosophila innubila]|nr:serine protease inhibitor 42Dd-like isoform X2 [Drosophila innubila]
MEYSNWRHSFNPLAAVTLNSACSLFVASDINILPDYLQQSSDIFGSLPYTVDFANSSATSHLINDWVANNTNDKITQLIDQTDGNMKVMLLSAIYFKGSWKFPFESKLTRKDEFYIPQETGVNRTVQVDMMSRKGRHRLNRIEKLDAMSLELPYNNSNLSMVILLPRSVDGIKKIIANLDQMDINEIAPKSYEMQVKIDLPKFKFDVNLELKDALKSLGLVELFSRANLSDMTDSKADIQINNVRQRAVIQVDEEGSKDPQEIKFSYINFPMVETDVRINHPFIFIIKDDDTVYLAGRVTME